LNGAKEVSKLAMMLNFLSFLFVALALLLAILVSVFVAEVVASITLPQQDYVEFEGVNDRRRVAILVPAHNESTSLLLTLEDIKSQMRGSDRLLVVADNCTDDTAVVAAAAGAEVINRNDPERWGKGYALDFGLNHLSADPPNTVIIIDADCRLADQMIDRLATVSAALNRPVQALYLMMTPEDSPVKSRVTEFAWRVRNWARPLGLGALGLPCQLMGTGMAFPWEIMRQVDLASGAIVEDMKLGIDLALAGNFPLFCPSAVVTSDFPSSAEGIQNQRLRWEHGHIAMIFATAPRLIYAAATRRNVGLLTMALDLAVPPLSLLGMLVIGMLLVSSLLTWFGMSSLAMIICAVILVEFLLGVLMSWLKYGRDIAPASGILSMITYAIRKLPIYGQFLFRKSVSQWIRTDRRKG
jgi:cellulose synthase/poly-beta-1,6-N-acetylglucosamine synthase-like glycosyltransferase